MLIEGDFLKFIKGGSALLTFEVQCGPCHCHLSFASAGPPGCVILDPMIGEFIRLFPLKVTEKELKKLD
jgi:hypothetical protein